MRRRQLMLFAVLALTGSAATAQERPDSAAFIIRLGTDTVAVERYVRTGNRVVAEAVQRAPTTMLHRLALTFGPGGRVTEGEWQVSRPGTNQPVLRRTMYLRGDSLTVETTQGGNTRTQRTGATAAIPIAGPFYTPYELAIMQRLANRAAGDSITLLAGAEPVKIPVTLVGTDSVALTNQFGEPMRAHIDRSGRLLHLHTPAFTTVERLRWINLERLTRDFVARDEAGKGMGPLSPRQAYRARVGNANLWIDYSRPGKRGRPIWGGLVPWNAVWRMGANEAAHFATDRAIDLGSLTLQPGTYTLFLLPTANEWQLIVNRATGMSGLEYSAAQDVGRVRMQTETLQQPVEQFTIEVREDGGGGVLALSWDRTRATVPIRVR